MPPSGFDRTHVDWSQVKLPGEPENRKHLARIGVSVLSSDVNCLGEVKGSYGYGGTGKVRCTCMTLLWLCVFSFKRSVLTMHAPATGEFCDDVNDHIRIPT